MCQRETLRGFGTGRLVDTIGMPVMSDVLSEGNSPSMIAVQRGLRGRKSQYGELARGRRLEWGGGLRGGDEGTVSGL